METLYRINSQITSTQHHLYSLNTHLEEKRQELERLALALSNLNDDKDGFQRNERLCLAPELSANTWHGQIAQQFQGLQENEIQSGYFSISVKQLGQVIYILNEKIRETKQSIINLRMDISSQISMLNDLNEQKNTQMLK